jgi:transposase
MGSEGTPGRATTRRYSPEEKARAVRLVRQLRKELGTTHGTVQRVADQIGCGVESLRTWVKQADIDEGVEPGVTSAQERRIRELEQENRELRRANDLLKRASSFFASVPASGSARRGSLVSSLPREGAGGLSGDVRPRRAP